MWSDNETAEDLLGFQVHADLIRRLVLDPKMLPVTVGVFGDWGGGKTSLMRMLEHDLDPESWPAGSTERSAHDGVAVIYVNPWLFEGYDDAKAALLGAVLLQLGEHKRFGPMVRDKVLGLLTSIKVMRALKLGVKHVVVPAAAGFATGGVAAVPAAVSVALGLGAMVQRASAGAEMTRDEQQGAGTDWNGVIDSDVAAAAPMDVRTFRERFAKMLADSDIRSLVVLIDDLDRCTPERIIDNLEAIKLFLSVDRTAFVVGADPRIVQHAIRSRYAGPATRDDGPGESERLVKDYLEKLVQVPYRLPRLSASEIETYMGLLFCKQHLSADEATVCVRTCGQERAKNRYGTFGYAAVKDALKRADLGADLTSALTLCASAAPLIADGLKGNPRQVKRFLNALLLRKQLAAVAKLAYVRDDVLVKLMILEYSDEERFLELFGWQARQDGHPQELVRLEAALLGPGGKGDNEEGAKAAAPGWATAAIRRWVTMAPSLSEVDLRDYFWVARDRLESTFTGLSLIPPVVRSTLDSLVSGVPAKRNPAVIAAKSLGDEERSCLLTLIEQLVARQPDKKTGYEALRVLAEGRVAGAAELLGTILEKRPDEPVPPSVGADLVTLARMLPERVSQLEAAIGRLEKSNTKVGKAVQDATKGKR